MSKEFMAFDNIKSEKITMVPAGRHICLMCEKKSRDSKIIKITEQLRVRMCPKCYKIYFQDSWFKLEDYSLKK